MIDSQKLLAEACSGVGKVVAVVSWLLHLSNRKKKEITAESITTMQATSTSIISINYACALDAHVVMQNCLKLNALVILRNFSLSCCLYLNRV
jgi:hypothetical protein